VATQDQKIAGAVKKMPLHWDDLLTLATLAREGSWREAAVALKLTRNTVLRRIQRLELSLDAQLVEESQGRVVLTPRGREAVAVAQEMGELAEAIGGTAGAAGARRRDAADSPADEVHGLVRVTAPEGISAHIIAPALGSLLRQYPALRIDLIAASAVLSISHKQADVAVRLTQPEDEHLIGLRAGTLTYSLYGAADGAHGDSLVGYDASGARNPETLALQRMFHDRQQQVRSNSLLAQVEAVRGGAGASLLPDYLARQLEGLRKLSDLVLEKPVFVIFHAKHRETPRVRAVTAWLQQLMLRSLGQED
jgi:DNA-binding transcriptional LysR family regulator